MSNFASIEALAAHLRLELESKKYLLLFAYNGTGKTRLSVAFKDIGKKPTSFGDYGSVADPVTEVIDLGSVTDSVDEVIDFGSVAGDTLYFNAFTEDLFSWDNDLDGDEIRELRLNTNSRFFKNIFEYELDISNRIRPFLSRYADFNFEILTKEVTRKYNGNESKEEVTYISFERDELVGERLEKKQSIKVSRGEENTFIWCFFMALCELAIDRDESYKWVKYIYIDDPITSLDDNNSILIACDLVKLIQRQDEDENADEADKVKAVISTHHSLFFNVIYNEFGNSAKRYFLHKERDGLSYILLKEEKDSPIAYHVSVLSELKHVRNNGNIRIHHFGILRAVLEKTSVFFGYKPFSDCLRDEKDKDVYARFLNLFSHGKASLFEFKEPNDEHKAIFVKILDSFLEQYQFNLPILFEPQETRA
jgi:hypothetical protein